jgi:hypothetical protein
LWLIPFVPFLSLSLTTPHNLVLLYAMIIVFTAFPAQSRSAPRYIPILFAAAALATHPLLGVPLVLFAAASHLRTRAATIAAPFAIALAAPALFLLNNIRAGAGWPHIVNPLARLPDFFALFARPYWYLPHAPALYEILYAWQWCIVPAVIALAAIGFRYRREWLLPLSALGLAASAWLLTSWIVFPDVVQYEQGEYPTRLLKSSLIFLLPLAMEGLERMLAAFDKKKLLPLAYAGMAFALMLSLYFSYPQRNIKARFPGYNVTAADFHTVEWIHNDQPSANSFQYIVLSNQLVSAAALTRDSFATYFDSPTGPLFYYALPTGGELYRYYGRMIYEGQKREYMEDAMALAGVRRAYFVVNAYWANADKIIDGAKKTADRWESIDGGAVWVFVYEK